MKKPIILLAAVAGGLLMLFPPAVFPAGAYFTVALSTDSYVIMDDITGTLTTTVTNTSSLNRTIKFVRFEVNSSLYNFSTSNDTPSGSGWMVKEINNSFTATTAMIEFSAEKTWAELSRGESFSFSLILTGPGLGTIAKDSADRTDTFVSVSAWEKAPPPPPGRYGDAATLYSSIPTWKRYALKCDFFLAPDALAVGKDINMSISVVNVSTASQSLVSPQSLTKLGTGNATVKSGFSPATLTLAPDETKILQATYLASAAGNLKYTVIAKNASASTPVTQSNEVYIGNFTASLKVTPDSVAIGGNVTLTLSVTNNGTTLLHNIVPSTPVFSGTATATRLSGPSPASLSVLSPGETYYFFTWTYRVTGEAGSTYAFSARATCAEGSITNTAASNSGMLSVFAFTLYPTSINSGSLDKAFTFNIQNGGKTKVVMESVEIQHPSADFIFGSASGGYGGNWTVTALADSVKFTAPSLSQYLPGGQQMNLTVTYAQTPTVASTTSYRFDAALSGSTNVSHFGIDQKFAFLEHKSESVLVTNSVIKLDYSPADVSADGSAVTTVTLTLLDGDTAMPGRPVDFRFYFTTTYEQNPFWTSKENLTDQQGQARAKFRAPYNAADCSIIVEGIFGSTLNQIEIPFRGYDRPTVLYSGSLAPVQVAQGASAQFSLKVRNTSKSYPMNLTTGSYFLVADDSLGGTSQYKAFLTSGATVPVKEVLVTLTFQSKVFPAAFFNGQFKPALFLTDGNPENDQTRDVTDKLIVGTGSSGIRIIDWRIKR